MKYKSFGKRVLRRNVMDNIDIFLESGAFTKQLGISINDLEIKGVVQFRNFYEWDWRELAEFACKIIGLCKGQGNEEQVNAFIVDYFDLEAPNAKD